MIPRVGISSAPPAEACRVSLIRPVPPSRPKPFRSPWHRSVPRFLSSRFRLGLRRFPDRSIEPALHCEAGLTGLSTFPVVRAVDRSRLRALRVLPLNPSPSVLPSSGPLPLPVGGAHLAAALTSRQPPRSPASSAQLAINFRPSAFLVASACAVASTRTFCRLSHLLPGSCFTPGFCPASLLQLAPQLLSLPSAACSALARPVTKLQSPPNLASSRRAG